MVEPEMVVMGESVRIDIDMDRKCVKCGNKGTAPNGWCLGCIAKNLHLFLKKPR